MSTTNRPPAAGLQFVAPFLLLAAFVLLLLVTLSTPIINSLHLFRLDIGANAAVTTVQGNLRFGVLGYCTSKFTTTKPQVFGIGGGTDSHGAATCSSPQLGYTIDIDPTLLSLMGAQDLPDLISKGTLTVFGLNPAAAVLTYIALMLSGFAMFKRASPAHPTILKFTLLAVILATCLALASSVANIVIVDKAKDHLPDGFTFQRGPAVTLAFIGTVALLFSIPVILYGMKSRPDEEQQRPERHELAGFKPEENRYDDVRI